MPTSLSRFYKAIFWGNDTVAVAMRFAMKMAKFASHCEKSLRCLLWCKNIASDCGCNAASLSFVKRLVPSGSTICAKSLLERHCNISKTELSKTAFQDRGFTRDPPVLKWLQSKFDTGSKFGTEIRKSYADCSELLVFPRKRSRKTVQRIKSYGHSKILWISAPQGF